MREAAQQRRLRFANKKNCQHLVSGIDGTVAHKAMKKLTKAQANHIRSWCPLRNVPAAPKHILWLCIRPFPYHGLKGCEIPWKNHFGPMDGYQRSRKTIWNKHLNSMDTDAGKASNHYHSNRGRPVSHGWPHQRQRTNVPKPGSTPSVSTATHLGPSPAWPKDHISRGS